MSEWSKTPPTDAVWYWWRCSSEDAQPNPLHFNGEYWTPDFGADWFEGEKNPWGEWWTTPIEEPPA